MLLMTVAGNETTRNATSQGLWALIEHPEQFDLLKENTPDLIDTAVDEIVRFATPVLHFRRTATQDTEINGQKINAGDKVVMWHTKCQHWFNCKSHPRKYLCGSIGVIVMRDLK